MQEEGKKKNKIQIWVVTLTTRLPLMIELPPTGNFRGANVSAAGQADDAAEATQLSGHFGKRRILVCFAFGLGLIFLGQSVRHRSHQV